MEIEVSPHPSLDLRAFVTELPRELGELPSSPDLVAALSVDTPAPLRSDDSVRAAVREMLRAGGFRPAGRSKPASEYLSAAAGRAELRPINAVVDACNVVSLHSGLPISVVDLDRARAPFRVDVAGPSRYVFNASGQEIDLEGLVCLFDVDGPCANAVKDSQRTKTGPSTRRTLSLVWGSRALPGRAEAAADWYRRTLSDLGATTESVIGVP